MPPCLPAPVARESHDLERLAARFGPAFGAAAAACLAAGLAIGLAVAAPDAEQGEASRIAVLHRPAAAIAYGIFVLMGALGVATLRGRARDAAAIAAALAPTGVVFGILALWTEALWRRPLQGQWWSWEAGTVSMLMLLFLYGGVLALHAMLDDPKRGDRAAALFTVLGLANLPVLYLSLAWWDATRHAAGLAAPHAGSAFAWATGLVGAGFACYTVHAAARRLRCAIAERRAQVLEHRRWQEAA